MAFKLNDKILRLDAPFSVGNTNYPANWLRLSTADEKTALGITEVEDPKVYNSRFYWQDGTEKAVEDVNATYSEDDPEGSYKKGDLMKDENGDQVVILGVKSVLKLEEKQIAKSLLNIYDWQVVRKAEKGTAMDSSVVTFRDGIRAAYTTRKAEIENCADTTALVNLYGSTEKDGVFTPNMTQYPTDPNDK